MNELNDGLLTIKQAAAFLNVSRSFLYRLMERGELAYASIGRTRRIPRGTLVALAARSMKGGGTNRPQDASANEATGQQRNT